ncbi:hypothetical protein HPB47_022207 [Ixodes persulcatus]|uniref:Uncharacterized protein n=1 Tax=Ixodes persulcatus TaxID=34615 RepID=A0AC60QAC2_IXOPE|nr:hypothetical protein HPB47_022207 [Ixodes persulcatus]
MTLKKNTTPDGMPHQLRLQGANTLIVIPGRAPVCLRCKRSGHIRRDCRVPKCSECSRFGHEKEECVRTYAGVTGGAVTDEPSQFIMEAEDAELAAGALKSDSPPSIEQPKQPPGAEDNGGKETAANALMPEGAAPSPGATSPEASADLPSTDLLPTEKDNEGVVDSIDENTDSMKRVLDETTPTDTTPNPNAWWAACKRGKYKQVPGAPSDERRRHDNQ